MITLSVTFLPQLSLAIKKRIALRSQRLDNIEEYSSLTETLEEEVDNLTHQADKIDNQVEVSGFEAPSQLSDNLENNSYLESINKLRESETQELINLMESEDLEIEEIEDKERNIN